MQYDNWHVRSHFGEGTYLRFPRRPHCRLAGFYIVDGNDLSCLVPQDDVSPNASVQSVARETLGIEALLNARRAYARKISFPHGFREFRVNPDTVYICRYRISATADLRIYSDKYTLQNLPGPFDRRVSGIIVIRSLGILRPYP
jgi:hypothetical protein